MATPEVVGAMIMDAFTALGPAGIASIGPPFTRYHDEEFTPTDIDVELAIPVMPGVDGPVQTPGGRTLVGAEIPGGEMAVLVHEAPYDSIDASYAAIGSWIAESGYHIAGPPQEAYLLVSPRGRRARAGCNVW